MPAPFVIFFDIGDTLAAPRLSAEGRLTALEPFPFVLDVLGRLRPRCPLGVISNTGTETLETMKTVLAGSGLAPFFAKNLLLFSSVEGKDKKQKAFFQLAVERAGVPAERCVYVGEDAAERDVARSAGMLVSFHPLHVFYVIKQMN